MDAPPLSEAFAESTPPPDDWSAHDIEEAYQKALRAIEEISGEPTPDATVEPAGAEPPETAVAADVSGAQTPAEPESTAPVQEPGAPPAVATNNPRSAEKSQSLRIAEGTSADAGFERTHVTPKQVIEAALFVGGGPITARKLAALLRGSFQPDVVEQMIDELNLEYAEQARPYEIRLGDGGYRLELRPEYDRLRQRVYGMGPREVKLSQDVLEVLAVIAYRQPVTPEELETCKPNSSGLLRQLIRRDLVQVQSAGRKRTDVTYHTTERFLSLFGLGSLDELPRPEDIEVK
jgi:segregation and condensation protein B